jgi:hypothetical protein
MTKHKKFEDIRAELIADTATIDNTVITADTRVVVEDGEGSFVFRYLWLRDGSLVCWGGVKGHESWRNFPADKCHLVGWVRPRSESDDDDDGGVSRKGKYRAFEQWAMAHDREQFTTEQLMEVSGFSRATVLKFVEGNPIFPKLKRGLYECRDIETARKSQK